MDSEIKLNSRTNPLLEIREHLTLEEKKEEKRLSSIYGNWIWYSFLISGIIAMNRPTPIFMYLAFALFPLSIIGIFMGNRKQKDFYSSTSWAKSQGYKPHDIKVISAFWELPDKASISDIWILVAVLMTLLIFWYIHH